MNTLKSVSKRLLLPAVEVVVYFLRHYLIARVSHNGALADWFLRRSVRAGVPMDRWRPEDLALLYSTLVRRHPEAGLLHSWLMMLFEQRQIGELRAVRDEFRDQFPLLGDYFDLLVRDFSKEPHLSEAWRQFAERSQRESGPYQANLRRGLYLTSLVKETTHLVKEGSSRQAVASLARMNDVAPLKSLDILERLAFSHRVNQSGRPDSHDSTTITCPELVQAIRSVLDRAPSGDRRIFELKSYAAMAWLTRADQAGNHSLAIQSFRDLPELQPYRPFLEKFLELSQSETTNRKILADIRTEEVQRDQIRNMIHDHVSRRIPFSLVRLGDGEAYAFRHVAPLDMHRQLAIDFERRERGWWDQVIDDRARQSIVAGVQDAVETADILGVPGLYRIAREIRVDRRDSANARAIWLVQKFVSDKILERSPDSLPILVDERVNIEICTKSYLFGLLGLVELTVLVGGFDAEVVRKVAWPTKIHYVQIPPHQRTLLQDSKKTRLSSLPQVVDAIKKEVASVAGPGVLVLVAAGIAGKTLCADAKRLGACALDIGSSLDHLLGFS